MNCAKLEDLIFKNQLGKLESNELDEVLEHVSECNKCRDMYADYAFTEAMLDMTSDVPQSMFIMENVNARLDKEAAKPALFDFLFGYGHNPIKAGLVVGLGLLAVVVLSANIITLNTHKPSKFENLYASNNCVNYTDQLNVVK